MHVYTTVWYGSSIAIIGFAIWPVLTRMQLLNYAIKTHPTVIVHSSMIGHLCWKKTGKIADLFGETHLEVKIRSPNLSQWNIAVLSIADLVQLST